MKNRNEIISTLNYAHDLLYTLGEGNNEIAEDLNEVIYQLEDEWERDLIKENRRLNHAYITNRTNLY